MMTGEKPSARRMVPRATYRLQFNRDFTLRHAIGLVPYLHELGVSHIYASPLLKACAGSTHGYDVCDCSQINPEIGTEAELESLVTTLRAHGMGLALDIVPNHMAASSENLWWWDVLQHGRTSHYANHFDIDWDSPDPQLTGKVLLPVLGDEYERVIERGELKVVCENAEVTVRYFDHRFPVYPESILVPHKFLAEAIHDFNAAPRNLKEFLDQQHYRLAFWRQGDSQINYRRFFNISKLAGVRVELPQVFADTHNRILDWHQRGWLDGLRIDHPDGLRDPQAYLSRLQTAAPGAWIVVEKILEHGEDLPPDWPVAGTTGYDFLNRVAGLFIEPSSENMLTEFYRQFTDEPADYEQMMWAKKCWALDHLLRAEMNRLIRLLQAIVARQAPTRKIGPEDWREALSALIVCLPVYRSYIQAGSAAPSAQDKQWLQEAMKHALDLEPRPQPALLAFLMDLLHGNLAGEQDAFPTSNRRRVDESQTKTKLETPHVVSYSLENGDPETEFIMRLQQLTGSAMAKGVEDTTFYCFNRFVALNEVGGDPGHFGISTVAFHQTCVLAGEHWPNAMLATSTHDTKRSEDVRARLALLSEIPAEWTAAVRRWSELNEKHRCNGYPDRNAEYLFYQTLVGAWPLTVDRALACMTKSSREAKQHTNWTEPNAAYDEALNHFVTAAMRDAEFRADLEKFVARLVEPGQINSLAQTLIKLTAPGVPDIYQGNELWDLSLMDPDNRRPVDFSERARLLAELKTLSPERIWQRSEEGLPKLWLIQQTLQFRRRHPEIFSATSHYESLSAHGAKAAHVVAFTRGGRLVTIVPRLVLRLANEWANTLLAFPEGDWRNELTGETITGGECNLAGLLNKFPVALLSRKEK